MVLDRAAVCESAGKKILASAQKLKGKRVFIGADGFVDSIISVVEKRYSPTKYDAVASIDAMGKKIVAAAGKSANFEMWVKLQKLGGNGPIMADAMASAGFNVAYVGMVGYPRIHAAFEPLARKAKAIGITDPGFTDALEFEDGKLLMGKYGGVNDINWKNLVERVGKERLRKLVEQSSLIGMLNWTMLPYLTELWATLHKQMLRGSNHNGKREKIFFADLCDPAKRKPADILKALRVLSAMQKDVKVILGLNLSEAVQVARVLGFKDRANAEREIEEMARDIRGSLKIGCVVIHPRGSAAAATENESTWFAGPFVQKPKLSTGAGDNFNAGFCLGQLVGLSLAESLAAATGTSGYYVRKARPPTAKQLGQFVGKMPLPEMD